MSKTKVLRMHKRLLIGTVALTLTFATVPADAEQRSLSDFTSRQGTWCTIVNDQGIDCAASYYGGPACEQGGFTSTFPLFWTDPKTEFSAAIDALGEFGDFNTTLVGSLSESGRPNGLANVKVVLHTGNALMQAFNAEFDPLFGFPTLGDALVQISFTNTASGAALPDVSQLLLCPAPGQALEIFSIHAQGTGPLLATFGVPEGTPGRLEVMQTGLIGTSAVVNPHSRLATDAYPAEKIIIRATGK
jgi:hypothetical protein